jgi:hypothetical protein
MEPLVLAASVGATLETLDIKWVLGGSLASSLDGEPRATLDIDLAIRLRVEQVHSLVEAFEDKFYVNESMAEAAARHHSSFNLLHSESVYKVDLFVLGDGLLDRRQIDRRRRVRVGADPPIELWAGSAEDQILRKLTWFRSGGEISDRQWRDVVGLLRVQSERLDLADLTTTAQLLGLSELLDEAIRDADE